MNDRSENISLSSRRKFLKQSIASIALGGVGMPMFSQAEVASEKKIKALYVTGGGYHDFKEQKKILPEGVSKLINIEWTIWHHDNAEKLKAALSVKGWESPYDVIVYNICHAREKDAEYIKNLVNVHKDGGKPMVAIHCTMHSYHWGVNGGKKSTNDKEWNKLLGAVSNSHGLKGPAIKVTALNTKHESFKPATIEWNTPKGELYTIHKIYPSATVLANGNNGRSEQPVVWVNQYGKANVFATTIGHHNETMQTDEYLQMIADGIVWAAHAAKV
ncbi:ThuA domain-containing protein [Rubritalea profundi]|nr:ThuA domain-containing protein [Rubritalea profundi]